jgi:hypothetical protein
MNKQNFTLTQTLDQSPTAVFNAINDVRGWWSAEIEGHTVQLNDEFRYQYQDVHRSRIKIIESVPGKKVVWQVLDNYFSFTRDESEWKDTKIIFEIDREQDKTRLRFTHEGLTPEHECYNACANGWTQYVQHSLPSLIATGKGQPNSRETAWTVHEVAARFNELALQEKWFDIQDELFAGEVKSIEPENSPWLQSASGKENVRRKAEDWVKRIAAAHRRHTTPPVVAGNHFAVGREADITVKEIGRIQINQVMLYEVKDGKIISEQFFY